MYQKKIPSQVKPLSAWTRADFVAEIATRFVYSEKTARIIFNALKYKKNVMFWGPGGHAKSEIVEYALRMILTEEEFYKDTFITACGGKMRSEQFQGFQSLPAFKEGRSETIMNQTMFVSAKYAILDEVLAAPSPLLLFLRDGISRGELCVDGVCYTVITKNIFTCTNIDPTEWANNGVDADDVRSRKAFLQRFLYRKEVKWAAYEAENFGDLFVNQTGADEPMWSEICAATHKLFPDDFSPRTAMAGLDMYRAEGLEVFEGFDGISDATYEMWLKLEADKAYISEASRIARESQELETLVQAATTKEQFTAINSRCNHLLNALQKLKIPKDAKLYENIGTTRARILNVGSFAFDESQKPLPKPTW